MDNEKVCDDTVVEEKDTVTEGKENPEVIIYTSDTCGYCHAAKEYFDSIGVQYTEKNVSQDVNARKELIQKKFMGVPVIIIGDETIQGFNKERLSELFEK